MSAHHNAGLILGRCGQAGTRLSSVARSRSRSANPSTGPNLIREGGHRHQPLGERQVWLGKAEGWAEAGLFFVPRDALDGQVEVVTDGVLGLRHCKEEGVL